jgi:hypothetical protein
MLFTDLLPCLDKESSQLIDPVLFAMIPMHGIIVENRMTG